MIGDKNSQDHRGRTETPTAGDWACPPPPLLSRRVDHYLRIVVVEWFQELGMMQHVELLWIQLINTGNFDRSFVFSKTLSKRNNFHDQETLIFF